MTTVTSFATTMVVPRSNGFSEGRGLGLAKAKRAWYEIASTGVDNQGARHGGL
jgi:hypothetical protein